MARIFSPQFGIFMAAIMACTFLMWAQPVHSQTGEVQVMPREWTPDPTRPQQIRLVYGKAVILSTPDNLTNALVADPAVVQVEPIFITVGPNEEKRFLRQVYLRPLKAGLTNLTFWQGENVAAIYELQVSYDLTRLKQDVHEVFPDEPELRIMSTHDSITLTGQVSSTSNMDQILTLTSAYAPAENIINLVQVGGVHQVMLEVKVAEVVKGSLDRLGVNFNIINKSEGFAIGFLGGMFPLPDRVLRGAIGSGMGGTQGFSTGAYQFQRDGAGRNIVWEGIFDVLKEQDMARILAEPSLIALSGQSASFLAGGEFPVPQINREGITTGVGEWKTYGIELAFTPTVLSNNRIAIEVVPVVSELDWTNAIDIGGSPVPALKTRKAKTTVELGDGQSFAIAGLLSEASAEFASRFPGLGDLPILGLLFSNKRYQSKETELVILVTPRLVKPLVAREQNLPTDFYIPPTDTEFYMQGLFGPFIDHVNYQGKVSSFDGEFGHVVIP